MKPVLMGAWADRGEFTVRACINIPRDAEPAFSLEAFTPLTILDASSPLSATLYWGLYSASEMGVDVDIDFSTKIESLSGHLYLYVDDRHTHCKHWYEPWTCHLSWHRVETKTIVSWQGSSYNHTLLNRNLSETLEL